jgi:putative transposase
MPWKFIKQEEQRFDLVRQMAAGNICVTELCRRFRISRQTAYKWRKSYQRDRLRGLKDRSRRPHRLTGRTSSLWLRRLRRWRGRHRTWGARKLRHEMTGRFGRFGAPSVATITRWLKRWGLSRGRTRRRRGPRVTRHPCRRARRCHEVWTVDFKGWYRTQDGRRVEPLTVRDLHSRYGLRIALLRTQSIAETRREFDLLFAKHGRLEPSAATMESPLGPEGRRGSRA